MDTVCFSCYTAFNVSENSLIVAPTLKCKSQLQMKKKKKKKQWQIGNNAKYKESPSYVLKYIKIICSDTSPYSQCQTF